MLLYYYDDDYYYNTYNTEVVCSVYLPTYFKDAFDQEKTAAGLYAAMFTLIGAASRIPAGFICDAIKFIDGGLDVELCIRGMRRHIMAPLHQIHSTTSPFIPFQTA